MREINWTNNLIIMSRAKTVEEPEFYLTLAVRNRYSKRELERQIESMLFERTMLSDEKNKLFIAKSQGLTALRDSYVLEFLDLLFYNRELSCLVAIELKFGEFKPEHLGQLEFYLEALDSDIKKPNENPSVGLILCADKDDTVVEYALRRSLSPALVAQYQLHLPNPNSDDDE